MPAQSAQETKQRIINFINRNGPSLPIHIARDISYNTLFTSAFLSELLGEKNIKTSWLRVGGSPLYLIPGQEPQLEKFSDYLNSKEKEAFLLLKQNKFLHDEELQPAIRVAMREIKDFAIPFKNPPAENIVWKYFTVDPSEYQDKKQPVTEAIVEERIVIPVKKGISQEPQKELDIFENKEKLPVKLKNPAKQKIKARVEVRSSKKAKPKKSPQKGNDRLFNSAKEYLQNNDYEIIDVIGLLKDEIILKVKKGREEQLIVAYNKKRLIESDIIRANKKSSELNLPYTIISRGEPSKKLQELIEAAKNLSNIQKIE